LGECKCASRRAGQVPSTERLPRGNERTYGDGKRVDIRTPPDESGRCRTIAVAVEPLNRGRLAEARREATDADGEFDRYRFPVIVAVLGCPTLRKAAAMAGADDAQAWAEHRFRYEWGVLLQIADAIYQLSGIPRPSRRPGRTFEFPQLVTPPLQQAARRRTCYVSTRATGTRPRERRPGARRVARRSRSACGSPSDSGDGEPDPAGGRVSSHDDLRFTGVGPDRGGGP